MKSSQEHLYAPFTIPLLTFMLYSGNKERECMPPKQFPDRKSVTVLCGRFGSVSTSKSPKQGFVGQQKPKQSFVICIVQ